MISFSPYPLKPRGFHFHYAWGVQTVCTDFGGGWGAHPLDFSFYFRSSRGGSPFLKDEKRGKRIFLRGRLPYARERKEITSRLTLKRNAKFALLLLLFLMRKARKQKTKGFCLARIYPSFGARPRSVSCPRGEVSDAKHCVLHKPPFAFTPSQAQSAKRCASERGFLLFLLSRAEGKLPSIKDFLSAFLVSLQERQASAA